MSDAWPPIGTTRPNVAAEAAAVKSVANVARRRYRFCMIDLRCIDMFPWSLLFLDRRGGRRRCRRRLCGFRRLHLHRGWIWLRSRPSSHGSALLKIHLTFGLELLQKLLNWHPLLLYRRSRSSLARARGPGRRFVVARERLRKREMWRLVCRYGPDDLGRYDHQEFIVGLRKAARLEQFAKQWY